MKIVCSDKSINHLLAKSKVSYCLELSGQLMSWRRIDDTLIADSAFKKIASFKEYKFSLFGSKKRVSIFSSDQEAWEEAYRIYKKKHLRADFMMAVSGYDYLNRYIYITYYAIYDFNFNKSKKKFSEEVADLVSLFADYVEAVTHKRKTTRILTLLIPAYTNFLNKYKDQSWNTFKSYIANSLIFPDIAKSAISSVN